MNDTQDAHMGEWAAKRARMEAHIRRYFDACNAPARQGLMDSFTDDAVHYFPANRRYGPWRGAAAIADGWLATVKHTRAVWTVDRVLIDPTRDEAAIEWTQFRPASGKILRGDEWYLFDPASGKIKEVRCYFAAPEPDDAKVTELGGFDYAGRGYPLRPPR
ncbi:MAG: nuclear transport factor 2 family protein [Alphaproteobacteria bacterium]